MIINIDTQKESAESLKKIASFLNSLATDAPAVSDEASENTSFALFDQEPDSSSQKTSPSSRSDDDDDDVDSFTMIPY